MLVFGIILIAVAALLWFFSGKASNRAFDMKATETTRVGDLLKVVGEVAADMPDGKALGFSQYVELKGQFVADRPVTGQLSGQPAAIVDVEVEHVFEEYRESRDSQGRVSSSWSRSSENLSRDRRETDFSLDDGSGRIRVKAGNAAELLKIKEEFQPATALQSMAGGGSMISFGGLSLSFGGGGGASGFGPGRMHYGGQGFFNTNSRRTLGYRFVEKALPLGRSSYVLGEAVVTEDEGLVVRAPSGQDKKKAFVVAARSEEDLVKGANRKALGLKIGAGVLGAGGIALIIAGVL
jgi:hypothetical protein